MLMIMKIIIIRYLNANTRNNFRLGHEFVLLRFSRRFTEWARKSSSRGPTEVTGLGARGRRPSPSLNSWYGSAERFDLRSFLISRVPVLRLLLVPSRFPSLWISGVSKHDFLRLGFQFSVFFFVSPLLDCIFSSLRVIWVLPDESSVLLPLYASALESQIQ